MCVSVDDGGIDDSALYGWYDGWKGEEMVVFLCTGQRWYRNLSIDGCIVSVRRVIANLHILELKEKTIFFL